MRVLYAVSPIGLGHATRASAVAQGLEKRGAEVSFATGGNAAEFLKGEGRELVGSVSAPTPAVSGGEMKRVTLWYARYWLDYRRTRASMKQLVDDLRPDLIVGDEEFSSVSIAIERHFPHALVTDEEDLGFARTPWARSVENRVSEWYHGLLDSAAAVIVPDFGADAGNRRHVGPIVRAPRRDAARIRAELSLPPAGQMVLLSLSGSGIGEHLLAAAVRSWSPSLVPGSFLAVAGNRGRRLSAPGVYDLGVQRDNQDLIAAADLVVSTAGKSTIDEAASSGTPIVAIPIRNHSEQVRNAAALGFSPDDLDRLGELIAARVGRRTEPRSYHGAEAAAGILMSLSGRP